jgi:rare lipoprotein A
VKVDYVGRAPLAGSDDRKLMATLREDGMPAPSVQVASNKPFTPAFFDNRPMTEFSSRDIPAPPDRPYRLGEGAREVPAVTEQTKAPTTELAAATRPRETAMRAPAAEPAPYVSPVSAYAAPRYDGAKAGFMSGRGLY